MKNKNLMLLAAFGLFVALLPLLVLWYYDYQSDHFSCESETTFYKNGYTFSTILHFSFRNGTGTFDALGEYKAPGKPTQKVTQKLDFEYWKEGYHILLLSKENDRNQSNINSLSAIVPDFFLLRSRGLSLKFLAQNSTSYLVVEDDMPLLYCIRTDH